MIWRAMRVLIIGGTGFIGPWVVRQLCQAGHQVLVYHRGETEADLPAEVCHVRHAEASLPVTIFADELAAWRPDAVLHMMAMGEADSRAFAGYWKDRVQRMVAVSSGDVYRAYGRFSGIEPGPPDTAPLAEDAPLRRVLYPYRVRARSESDMLYWYDKILVERNALEAGAAVLRLPKVYGPGRLPNSNSDFATVYSFAGHPEWRWTHGYVENVATAIVLAVIEERAGGRVYNVGEEPTPTIRERLAMLPPPAKAYDSPAVCFDQDMIYDTSRIRSELGYCEVVPYEEGIRRTLERI